METRLYANIGPVEALWAIIGVVVGAVLPRLLESRAQRQSDVREIRLALIETRDLVWRRQDLGTVRNHSPSSRCG